jgi:hypothetical protein
MMSPTKALKSPIDASAIVFVDRPVLIPTSGAAQDASRTMHAHLLRLDNDVRKLSVEANFYAIANSVTPAFAMPYPPQTGGAGMVSAEALFGSAGCSSALWGLPLKSLPELHVRSVGSDGDFHPGWNGEVKTAGSTTTLDQAVVYTLMDTVRVFFPAPPVGTPRSRRFFSRPPTGYALAAFPHVGYILAIEWVGRVMVSLASEPFVLGSAAHHAAVAALEHVRYDAPAFLEAQTDGWVSPAEGHERLSVSWHRGSGAEGRFRKLLRCDAYPAARFCTMARVYAELARFHSARVPHPESVIVDAQMLFGDHEVLVNMELVVDGAECSDNDVLADAAVLRGVADAVAWLAAHRIIYTDIRGPNVLRTPSGGVYLIDYDDCELAEAPVTTYDGYLDELRRHVHGDGGVAGTARTLTAPTVDPSFATLVGALQAAFTRSAAGVDAAAAATTGRGGKSMESRKRARGGG